MIAQAARNPRPCCQRPAPRRVSSSWRVLAPRRRIRKGSLAWWGRRLLDPHELLGFKALLIVAVFAVGGLTGP